MVFKFHSVKSITDESERRYRLAALFRIFEDTPTDSQVHEAQESAGAEATNHKSDRQRMNPTMRRSVVKSTRGE